MKKQPIQCGASLSTLEATPAAIAQVCADVAPWSDGAPPDLAVVFASPHYADEMQAVADAIAARHAPRVLVGCTGESIAGMGQEVERQPAISLFLARLPDVNLTPMHLDFERTPDGGTFTGWPESLRDDWPAGSSLMLLGDPFSFPADALLERLGEDQPHLPIFGGMASGAAAPGDTRLLLGGEVHDGGAVALLIDGPVRIRTIVSQGCRPIGAPFVVTKAERNVMHELGGAPAMHRLNEVFAALPNRERQLVQHGLHVGRVMNEYQEEFQQGDFLIKNVLGADPQSGGIAIGDYVRVGQTVQFHVRDEASADAELGQLLGAAARQAKSPPAGGLLFTCNGRGTRMFSTPHHDAAKVRAVFEELPLAGFFAQGEIGPVAGKNYIHGFTASVALVEEVDGES